MITIISPAKTMNFEDRAKISQYSKPLFINRAEELAARLQKYSAADIGSLMKVSDDIAHINLERYALWNKEHNPDNAKQAVFAYDGAVYRALDSLSFDDEETGFAQKHLRILSGLYGVLRPLDIIQPYRLEMAIKLENSSGKDLYCFWKDTITEYLNEEIGGHGDKTLVNLASNEYFTAIDLNKFNGRIVTPIFKEYRKGTYKIIAINAKKARGLMARYIIKNKIDNPEDLRGFEWDGYLFNEAMSDDKSLVFTRDNI